MYIYVGMTQWSRSSQHSMSQWHWYHELAINWARMGAFDEKFAGDGSQMSGVKTLILGGGVPGKKNMEKKRGRG